MSEGSPGGAGPEAVKKTLKTRSRRDGMRRGALPPCSAITGVIALVASALVPLARAQLASSPWPMFQHDPQHTGQSQFDTSSNIGGVKWTSIGDGFVILVNSSPVASSPALASDGTIYVGGQNGLNAINPDGSQKWVSGGNPVVSSPAVGADGTIYFGDFNGSLDAINPDGSVKWEFNTHDTIVSSPAVTNDGTIYIGSLSGNFYAINSDGTQKWVIATDDSVAASPALAADGTIYQQLVLSNIGGLYAINPDGTLKWVFSAAGGFAAPWSSAVGADGTIYAPNAGDNGGALYAINPDGTQKWVFNVDFWAGGSPAVGTGGTIYLSRQAPVMGADGTIYARGDNVYAINPDGSQKWVFIPQSCTGRPRYCLYAINPDGTQKWQFFAGNAGASSPAVGADGTIYFGQNSGEFYALSPHVALSPANVSFGNQPVGVTSAAWKVTLANEQTPALNISKISTSGDFAVSSTTCGSSLAPGANCTISVTFTPSARGTRTGMLTVNDSAKSSPQTTSLSGTGTVPFVLSPASASFSTQPVGITSLPKGFVLTNQAAVSVPISSISASGDFSVSSTMCGSSLGPLASCGTQVTFKPTTIGARAGVLTVTDGADNSPQTASLSGIGTWVTATPTTLPFGNQRVGTTSAGQDVTLTNKGSSLIYISNITASGDFAASSTTCGSTLASGGKCTVSVTFSPGAVGAFSGTLTVSASAPVPTVGLTGTGV